MPPHDLDSPLARQLTGAAAKFRPPPAKARGAQPPDAPPKKTRGAGAVSAALAAAAPAAAPPPPSPSPPPLPTAPLPFRVARVEHDGVWWVWWWTDATPRKGESCTRGRWRPIKGNLLLD